MKLIEFKKTDNEDWVLVMFWKGGTKQFYV